MPKTLFFISHIHEDYQLAASLKDLIEEAFAGAVEVFVSSESIAPGDDGRERIRDNLQRADDFLILLTPRSYTRPWVNFEAGAALGRNIRFIPVLAKGLAIRDVGSPLGDPQMLSLDTIDSVTRLITTLAQPYGYRPMINKQKAQAVLEKTAPQPNELPGPMTPEAKRQEPVVLQRMRKEHDALKADRQTFWETLNRFYEPGFRGRPGYPDTLDALVDAAEPPRGLPLDRGEDLRDYPTRHRRLLAGSDSLLFALCGQVYPSRQPGLDLIDCTAIPRGEFDAFHQARGALAKFWNRWGQFAYEGGQIGLDTIVRSFDAHLRLVKLLSYLEVCLVLWTEDSGVGKQWLFRLGRDWRNV